MLILALGGVVLGFAFLLLSLLTDNAAWAYGCIAVCVAAGVVLVLDVLRRRRPSATGQGDAPRDAPPAAEPGTPSGEPAGDVAAAPGTDATATTPVTGTTADDRVDRGEGPTEIIAADRAAGTTPTLTTPETTRDVGPDPDRDVRTDGGDAPTQQIPAVPDDEVSAAELLAEPAGRHGRPAEEEPAPVVAQDEPDVEDPTSQDGATAAASEAEVLVVDERPRFHVAGCSWLADRETIPLPAREAVDLGFSPCAVCRPVAALARG
ncbi:hypothetical protein GCM10027047_17660 [Rhodococcus aerolatus]